MYAFQKECEDIDYLEIKEKYEKDLAFYEEHKAMMDHVPDKSKYKGTLNIGMTELGKRLLEWYTSNIEE